MESLKTQESPAERIDPTEMGAVLERLHAAEADARPTVAEFAEAAGATVEEVEAALRAVRASRGVKTRPRWSRWALAAGVLATGVVALNFPLSADQPMVQGATTFRHFATNESFGEEGLRAEVFFRYHPPTLWRAIVGPDLRPAGPVSAVLPDGRTVSTFGPLDDLTVKVRDFDRIGPGLYHAAYEVPYAKPLRLYVPWNVDGKRFETQIAR